jgi:hypothetical protein
VNFPVFQGNGTGANDNVIVQGADGSLDAIGFTGAFANGSLSFTNSFQLLNSAGSAPVQAVNQEQGGFFGNESIPGGMGMGGATLEGVQFVQQLANGTFNNVFADSGYGDPTHQGTIYASNNLNLAMPGWHAVDAGLIAREVLPLT